ncbi:hypothetical protein [Methylocella sp.]|uniref:hypothetical protein n=1 Tax=Methylocella sp. TaxID=1978226 RepID=UPI003784BDE0
MIKASGDFAFGALGLALLLAVVYPLHAQDWHWARGAVICTPRLTASAAPGDVRAAPVVAVALALDRFSARK